jgi:hypothetical protein
MKIKNFRDKIAFSGITTLGIGIALLVITFASAFGFLADVAQVFSTQNIMDAFGSGLLSVLSFPERTR